MVLNYDIAVDLTPEFNKLLSPKFSVSLGDHGSRQYMARILQSGEPYEIAENSTVSIVGKKSDGHIFAYACTYSDEYVYFTIEEQMTPVQGIVTCELSIADELGNKLGSANFTYWVEPSPVSDGDASDSDLQLFQEAIDAASDVQRILDSFGGPNVAHTADEMVNTSKVYVYIGNETGYTYGHWYYYDPDDSTWQDGGIYQSDGVNTDTTLTASGVPADAKATGDAIATRVSTSVFDAEVADLETAINGKVSTTTFSSTVQGLESEIDTKQDILTFDPAPTEGSTNPVTSGGLYTALGTKQNTLTFDITPTQNSANPVKSGGVYSAIETVADASENGIKRAREIAGSAYVSPTVTGELITFTDGADGIPVKSLTLTLAPHQDGSGDPAPDNVRPISGYDAVTVTRAGKNLAYMPPITLTMGVQRNANVSTPISIPIGTYTASLTVANNTTTKAFNIAFRNSANASVNIAQLTVPAGRTGRFSITFTSTDIIDRFYVYLSTSEADGATITFNNLQVEAGEIATEYEPFYSDGTNQLPVYDRTTDTVNGITLTNSNGEYTLNGTSTARAQFDIPVDLADGMYLVSAQNEAGNSSVSIFLMNSDGDVIHNEKFYVAYHSFVFDQAVSKIVKFRISIANGTTLSDFKLTPLILKADFYKTYTLTIPTSAGTVYGGSLVVDQDGSGTLTVDTVKFTTTWGAGTQAQSVGSYERRRFATGALAAYPNYRNTPVCNLASYRAAYDADELHFYVNNSTTNNGFVFLPVGTDDSTAIEIAYEIANPQTYTLTAEQVTTLLGDNTLWMDADGTIDLTYRADTQMYIDNRIALLNSNLAYIEDGMTASRAYTVGQFVLIGGQLYKVTASIASGATFTIGTNVTATTVGTELTALA